MSNDWFAFKQFKVRHGRSSMKVGIDSVLLGSWVTVKDARRVLDVGTGCGILSLMCAQRNPHALIDAIDIHDESVEEAKENFLNSPWKDRLKAEKRDFLETAERKYDLIISNPPYFNSGLESIVNPRECARHQASLSPGVLLSKGRELMEKAGTIAMIFPYVQVEEVVQAATALGMRAVRAMEIRGRDELPCKRVMMEFKTLRDFKGEMISEEIILEESPGCPSQRFKTLCQDFYLKF